MSYYQLPPKSAFPHNITYKEKRGEDDYQKVTYGPEVTISHVWFNLSSTFSRSGNNSSDKAAKASITMFNRYCGSLPIFKRDCPIFFNGHEYNIVLTKELILNGEIIGWRLEVV